MKKIITLMVLLAIGINLLAWDAPQPLGEPTTSDLVVGQTYYIRNVGCKQYMAAGVSWGTQLSFTVNGLEDNINQPIKIKIEEATTTMGDNTVSGYSMFLNGTFRSYATSNFYGRSTVGNTYIFRSTEEAAYVDYKNQGKGWIWDITKTDQGYYRISTAANDPAFPTANQYAGWNGTNITANNNGAAQVSVIMNLTSGNIDWELIDASTYDAAAYQARLCLYATLQKAEVAGVSTIAAGAVYTNPQATAEDIYTANSTLVLDILKAGWDSGEATMEGLTPAPDTIVSGKYYYLYNVDAQMFLGRNISSTSNPDLRYYTHANERVLITKQSNGNYTMQFSGNNNYIYSSSSDCYTRSDLDNYGYCYWRFVDAGEGLYYIQRNYSYNASQYLGWASSNVRLYSDKSNITSNNVRWQLIDADEDEFAMAQRMMLYKSIQNLGGGELWPEYVSMLTDGSQTATSLYNVAAQLNNYKEKAKTDVPIASWNEVSMTCWSNDTWSRSTSDNIAYYYSWCSSYNSRNTGGTCSLFARVSVPELSKVGFEAYADAADVTFSILIDGEEVKTLNNKELENYYRYYSYNGTKQGRLNPLDGNWDHMVYTRDYRRYFVDIPKGVHTIEWRFKKNVPTGERGTVFYLRNLGILRCPTTISVNCVEPGSLGNEVLYHVDNVNDVRRLKIKGTINDDDWARIKMMTRLVALDLSETTITSLPASKFDNWNSVQWPYLSELVLPKGLKSIGQYCFRLSYVNQIDLPDSVETIGEHAFYNTQIKKADIKSSVKYIGEGAFAINRFLTDVTYNPSTSMTTIPSFIFAWNTFMKPFELPEQTTVILGSTFEDCTKFKTLIPEGVTEIGGYAFYNCGLMESPLPPTLVSVYDHAFYNCHKLNPRLPNTLKTISSCAFEGTGIDTLYIPDNGITIGEYAFNNCDSLKVIRVPESVSSIGQYAFAECNKLNSVEMPTSYYTIGNQYLFANDHAIKKLKLKSPTMVGGNKSTFLNGVNVANVTLQVPEHLVTTYKQDSYWYNYGGFEGIPSEEINYWEIRQPLKLTYRDRFEGNPDVKFFGTGSLTINGDAAMNLHNVSTYQNMAASLTSTSGTLVLSNCDNIAITGDMEQRMETINNHWYAFCLPFDFKVSDITTSNGAKYAIRYYDGAHRAENGNGGNWVDLPADTVVTAGTGFIYRTSKDCTSTFRAQNNGSRQTMFSNSEFAKQLQTHPSEDETHKGWNLVGNPYQCYYNIHKLNTTAPITVSMHTWHNSGWVGSVYYSSAGWNDVSYKAYSIIDDDYALLPNGAFFLQCPDEASTITFPTTGKQMTSTVTDQNGVKALIQQPQLRKLIDIRLYIKGTEDAWDEEPFYDQTRVVFNPSAMLGYERSCDASKFTNEDNTLQQLYTIGESNVRYAINERPTDDGTVRLGLYIPVDGDYTLRISRNRQAGTILLYDELTGQTTDITDTDYIFHAESGTIDNRFKLIAKSLVTDVKEITEQEYAVVATEGGIQTSGPVEVYGMDGRLIARAASGFLPLRNGAYIVRGRRKATKIIVK